MIVALSPLMGLDAAAHQAMALSALAGLLLIMSLARACGLSRWSSLLAALILATSPLYLMMSLNLMSDTPALVWVTAAVLLAWHSRSRLIWAPAAGVAFAMAVLTRPTNILAIVPIAICLGISPRRWFWLGVGGLPGAVLLVWFNLAAYGAALTTGYGDMSGSFAVANVEASVRNYVDWLPVLLTPIGVLALGLPALLRRAPRSTAVLVSWIAAFLVFYSFYFFTHETWWSLRFLLPAFPPIIVGSLLVGRMIVTRACGALRVPSSPSVRVVAGCLLAAMVVVHNVSWGRHFDVLDTPQSEHVYVEAAQWARAHLPPDAAIIAMQVSGSFFYYTDFPVLRYDYLDRDAIRKVQAAGLAGHQPLYAVLFPYEIEELHVFRDYLPGTWTQIGAVRHITFWEYRGTADKAVEAP
jgi:4-amino-4-deoxy-L-arabinose transferase-like glycosyltransferase